MGIAPTEIVWGNWTDDTCCEGASLLNCLSTSRLRRASEGASDVSECPNSENEDFPPGGYGTKLSLIQIRHITRTCRTLVGLGGDSAVAERGGIVSMAAVVVARVRG